MGITQPTAVAALRFLWPVRSLTKRAQVRAQQLDDGERRAMMDVLGRIEKAGAAIAAELQADVRIERDDRGQLPFLAFRAHGFRGMRVEPRTEPDRLRGL